ncbi:hypothetical protein [Polaribacter sp. Hel1_85]|uniref:hypothetical protein n=1 Tax=Polaribacter sp. Hel1_85 TaxID=1250005 RepID=UPI00052BC20E|nr:hypothetical protein [Polaribacter sp. Hel1_85]KGL61986.1 hypothetical protein PHEL85_1773 [Polaribacter sp. Hel1_85]
MEKKPNDVPKPNPRNTISLEIAKNWAKRWRQKESSYNRYHDCRAFNIPKKDLIEVLSEDHVESVRAYIGVEKLENECGDIYFQEKLMIVGVNKCGVDILSSSDGLTLDAESGNIYDFSSPCPNLCDPNSPLNGNN